MTATRTASGSSISPRYATRRSWRRPSPRTLGVRESPERAIGDALHAPPPRSNGAPRARQPRTALAGRRRRRGRSRARCAERVPAGHEPGAAAHRRGTRAPDPAARRDAGIALFVDRAPCAPPRPHPRRGHTGRDPEDQRAPRRPPAGARARRGPRPGHEPGIDPRAARPEPRPRGRDARPARAPADAARRRSRGATTCSPRKNAGCSHGWRSLPAAGPRTPPGPWRIQTAISASTS